MIDNVLDESVASRGAAVRPARARRAPLRALALLVLAALACGKDTSTGPTGAVARSLVIRDGDQQTGPAGSVLGQPLQVTAQDAAHNPVAGATVKFRVTRGQATGTTISDTVVVSGFDGTARVYVTLGTAVDSSTVEAFLGTGQSTVSFRLMATAAPQLASVSPTTVAAGDTVTLRGTNFNQNLTGNTVVFGTARARIVSGTTTELRVVVPPCVAAGPALVRVFVGSAPTNTVSATFAAGGSLLALAQYEGITVSGTDLGTCLRLSGAGAQYLLVPQSASSSNGTRVVDYSLGATTSGVTTSTLPPAAATVVPFARGSAQGTPGTLQQQLDATLRRRESELTRQYRGTIAPTSGAAASSAAPTPPALGSSRSFNVLASLDGTDFTTSTATLRFAGNHILIYVDTDQPAGAFTDAELKTFGDWFERDLYDVDVRVFGSESDLDGNGRVIVLLSPKINTLTPSATCSTQGFVTGFFYGGDLLTRSRGSNKGEVFYALVPDQNGTKSCAHTKAQVERLIPSTFIHEFQHMISYNQHVLARGGSEEALWLNEGLSHIAEELGSRVYEERYPAPAGRATAEQLFPDSSQGFITGDVTNAYRFLAGAPQHSAIALAGSASLEERGGSWIFLRWLADQKGESILGRLVQTSRTGTDNVQDKAGESFAGLFGDFATALYTDSLPGVPRSAIAPRLRFLPPPWAQRNLRRVFQRFYDTQTQGFDRPFPIAPRQLAVGSTVTGTVVPGSMEYFILSSAAANGSLAIRFSRQDGSAFASSDEVQIGVFRLK